MRRNFILLAALLIVAAAAYSDQVLFSPRDPGAARKNLSNVTPATGRAALELGTMATEAKTDYVATGTFTDHASSTSNPHSVTYTQVGALASEGKAVDSEKLDGLDSKDFTATSTFTAHESDTSTHGKTTLAGMEDIDDLSGVTDASTARTNLGVVASSDVVLTSGANAMTGSLKLGAGAYGAVRNTDDGADTGFTVVAGGGSQGSDRGGTFYLYGNEVATNGGQIRYFSGDINTGHHMFYTGNNIERLRIAYGGNVLIGTTTDDGTNKLQVNGPVYVASYVSALGYIDRTEAPDTLAEAYAIVQSHEVTATGELDHTKLHPAAWGKRVELQPTGKTVTKVVEVLIKDAESLKDGAAPTEEKIIEEPEMQQVVVPDQSGRDLSMVISAQAFVIKDLTKRIEALEATR